MSTGIVTLKPLGDRVVLKRLPQEEKTAGGIFLPDTAQEKPMKGEVVAVGPGKTLDSGEKTRMEVEVGQVVLFGKYSGTEVKIDGEDLLIMKESDIMGVIDLTAAKKAA